MISLHKIILTNQLFKLDNPLSTKVKSFLFFVLFVHILSFGVLALPFFSIFLATFNYIDPGSGSAILSAIVGFFVVIGLTIKSFWYKIKGLFGAKSADE